MSDLVGNPEDPFSRVVAQVMLLNVPLAHQVVKRPLWEWEVVGSIHGCAMPMMLKMVPVATLLGAQHNTKISTRTCPSSCW